MTSTPESSSTLEHFDRWLEQQILKLSVDALSRNVLTCTACPQVIGDYIIEYRGESLRLPAPKAYAFLRYVMATSPSV